MRSAGSHGLTVPGNARAQNCTAMLAGVALALGASAFCGCWQSHRRDDGITRDDGGFARDAGPSGCADLSALGRTTLRPALDRPCDDDGERLCRQAFQSMAPPGTRAVAVCLRSSCSSASLCSISGCSCHATPCLPSQICAQVPGEFLPRCVEACLVPNATHSECDPASPPILGAVRPLPGCTDAARTECQLWAQGYARTGRAVTTCVEGDTSVECRIGDACETDGSGRHVCTCGGVRCEANEVCIASASGPPRCQPGCVPADPGA